jgi:deoxyribodipyrimidine photolyase-related protein
VLVDARGQPEGGRWNYDAENRRAFGRAGPGDAPAPRSFAPDRTTRKVIAAVRRVLPRHPGSLDSFDWPVTPPQASAALADFVEHRLANFGAFQDAMWSGQAFLYHSRLSAALNLKLLTPRAAIAAAEQAFRDRRVPLNSAEGFIRQVLGWREYVRGVYWLHMPRYLDMNALNARASLPAFYWTGETDAACLREAITQTLRLGYAHHIQRLMVTGLFALLLGVDPREVHRWYLAVYVDAVEWVELPNTLGMSQYADGGIMASKPYVATGSYINRMSDYCRHCRFDPARSAGERACPFTTLYWDFLMRHGRSLSHNPRMRLQLRNLDRLGRTERRDVKEAAERVRSDLHAAV